MEYATSLQILTLKQKVLSLEWEAVSAVLATFRPPPRLNLSEWADEKRYLSPESSGEPGKYHVDRAPYQRGIMDAISNPVVDTVVMMMASQVGKTEILNNAVGYFIDQDPSPILSVQPSLDTAKTWSKDRLAPMLRDTPCLRGIVRDARASLTMLTRRIRPAVDAAFLGEAAIAFQEQLGAFAPALPTDGPDVAGHVPLLDPATLGRPATIVRDG